jgi:hypothetical protein
VQEELVAVAGDVGLGEALEQLEELLADGVGAVEDEALDGGEDDGGGLGEGSAWGICCDGGREIGERFPPLGIGFVV